jgi:hypothetical protein
MCELTNRVWRTELCRLRPLLSEMLMFTGCIDKYNIIMTLVVAPSFRIHFITFCFMYVLLSPTPTPHLCVSSAPMRRRDAVLLKPNVSVAKVTAEVHVRRPCHPIACSIRQYESRMNEQGEHRSCLYSTVCNVAHFKFILVSRVDC